MDVWGLTIFKTVAEQGSISKSALILNCVQSNVTARIKQLESELEVQLFYRKSRGMELTASGKTLLPYANEIERLMKEATRSVKDIGEPKGTLSIGTMASAAAIRLPTLLSRYQKKCPKVELELTTGPSEALVTMVLDYQIEGAFVAQQHNYDMIESYPAFDEELAIITAPDIHSLEDLTAPQFITFPKGSFYRQRLEKWAKENGIAPKSVMGMGTMEGILGFVSAGLGITLAAVSFVQKLRWEDKVRMHSIPPKYSQAQTMFIRRKDSVMTQAMQGLIDELKYHAT
ncbi:LysR family transcriptional regulator [uncultured Pseudodesulfovibrio sp.]|uniref:LysR family transcriptional regulator n=1 Tax=uncultured Pseudodesulfovibrio sp. TaxID=2035858 RepID=UPI0029C8A1C2|nr:LysR family transcriptional regulator [uncultured Pseudodesulfovibrio sp.]